MPLEESDRTIYELKEDINVLIATVNSNHKLLLILLTAAGLNGSIDAGKIVSRVIDDKPNEPGHRVEGRESPVQPN